MLWTGKLNVTAANEGPWSFGTTSDDGSVVWIADRGRLVEDTQNLRTRIVGVSVDLTRRKVLEEAMQPFTGESERGDRAHAKAVLISLG